MRRRDTWLAGFTVPLGLSEVRGSVARANMKGSATARAGFRDADDTRQIALGHVYNLSKRTAV